MPWGREGVDPETAGGIIYLICLGKTLEFPERSSKAPLQEAQMEYFTQLDCGTLQEAAQPPRSEIEDFLKAWLN